MSSKILKISSKGQIVIPKAVRDKIKSDFVILEFNSKPSHPIKITLSPLPHSKGVGGALKKYAKKYIPLDQARKIAAKSLKESY